MEYPEKQEKVLEGALEIIVRRGLANSPMSEIAREAGVAAGTIYHYYESKDELIFELFRGIERRIEKEIREQDDKSLEYKARFENFWKTIFQFFVRNPSEFSFLEQYSNSPQGKNLNLEFGFFKPVVEFLEKGMESGEIHNVPLDLLASRVYGGICSTAKLKHSTERSFTGYDVLVAFEMTWRGIVKEA